MRVGHQTHNLQMRPARKHFTIGGADEICQLSLGVVHLGAVVNNRIENKCIYQINKKCLKCSIQNAVTLLQDYDFQNNLVGRKNIKTSTLSASGNRGSCGTPVRCSWTHALSTCDYFVLIRHVKTWKTIILNFKKQYLLFGKTMLLVIVIYVKCF